MTENFEGPWTVERFDVDSDFPDWEAYQNFRSKDKAVAYAAQLNAKNLDQKNKYEQESYHRRLRQWYEEEVLIDAGLRQRVRFNEKPTEPEKITELGHWDERFRVVPMKFWDDWSPCTI